MLEQIKFINHLGEKLHFGQNGIYVNSSDIHDYKWEYQAENNRISFFERGIVSKTLPLIIFCETEEAGISIKNKLMEYSEKDILAKKSGKIIVGDYYLSGYIIGSNKNKYLVDKKYLEVNLEIVSDTGVWVREMVYNFVDGVGYDPTAKFLDMNYDYPHDLTNPMGNNTINNLGFTASDFKIIFYGECAKPIIYINGHKYRVNFPIKYGGKVTINSQNKKIIYTNEDGEEINVFKYRDRESYIFEKFPPGNNKVTWSGDMTFDIILLEERSEPKWT